MEEGLKGKVELAKIIARIAHNGQLYGSRGDYYTAHLVPVAESVALDPWASDVHLIVAYLHDAVEDTAVTLSDLVALGIPMMAVTAINAITKEPGEPYEAYLRKVASNPIARLVKRHDMVVNLECAHSDQQRSKYTEAIAKLAEL